MTVNIFSRNSNIMEMSRTKYIAVMHFKGLNLGVSCSTKLINIGYFKTILPLLAAKVAVSCQAVMEGYNIVVA